jgi:Ethanolamine utilization protein EutJ (predicted chaperonin)
MAEQTRWWRVFGLRRGEGRRRRAARFAHRARVVARCDSWPQFLELVTGDVSAGGMFVATDQVAAVGEAVELRIELPDGTELPLSGQVAVDGPDGLGIRLDPLSDEAAGRFAELLETARAAQPRADRIPDSEPPPLFVAPEGAEPIKLSSVHRALGADRIERIDPDEITGEHALDDIDAAVWEPPIEPGAPPSIAPRGQVAGAPIVGVDLGHSKVAISVIDGDRVRLVDLVDGGGYALPSAVRDDAGGSLSPKRELDERGAVEPCARLLERARLAAERRLDRPVTRAVLSVPIHFDDPAIERLRDAGRDAGLEVVAVIDEPSAAAAANRFDLSDGGLIGVYDFGGGSFDFSIVDASGGDLEVLATAGARDLGGDQLDAILAESVANQLARSRRVDIRQQPIEWRALLDACERAKRQLSVAEVAAIVVDDVFRDAAGPVDLRVTASRAIFEQASAHLIERSVEIAAEALERLGRQPGELSAIVLSGGTCRIPAVRRRLARTLPVGLCSAVPAEYAVCLGAGIHAAQLSLGRV